MHWYILVHVFVSFLALFKLDGELAYFLRPVFTTLLQLNRKLGERRRKNNGKYTTPTPPPPPLHTHTDTHTHTHTHTNIHKHACTHGCTHTPTHLPSPTNPVLLSKLPLLSSLMKWWRVFYTCCWPSHREQKNRTLVAIQVSSVYHNRWIFKDVQLGCSTNTILFVDASFPYKACQLQ